MFSIRGLRLYFPELEPWVARSALLPAVCPAYLRVNVRPRGATHHSACPVLAILSPALSVYVQECRAAGSASGQTACPVRPALRQSLSRHSLGSPLRPVPVSAPPTGLDECLFFISWVLDFLAIRFSISSGCARRRSMSTYAAILVLPGILFIKRNISHQHLAIPKCSLYRKGRIKA